MYLNTFNKKKTIVGVFSECCETFCEISLTASVQEDLSNEEREKRSLGFVASLFNRMMYHEVQDSMEHDSHEDDVINLVKCDLQLERKSCTIRETETICKNYFEPKCFLYTYPRTTITVERH